MPPQLYFRFCFFCFSSPKLWEGKKNKGLRQNHDRELVSLLALKESELHRFIFISSDMSNKIIYVCQPVHIPIATYLNYCRFVHFGDGDYIYLKQKMTFSKRLLLQCSTVITEVNWFVVFTFVWLVFCGNIRHVCMEICFSSLKFCLGVKSYLLRMDFR